MLNEKERYELQLQLYDVTNAYLKCKNSNDESMRDQTPVRASNLYAVLNVIHNIRGIPYPKILTESVINNAVVDAQKAFTESRASCLQ